MRARGGSGLGQITVQFTIANYGDIVAAREGDLPWEHVRRQTLAGIVD
jgi:hypothetical protein